MKLLHLEEIIKNGNNKTVCINSAHIVRMSSLDETSHSGTRISLTSIPVPTEVTESIEDIIKYCEVPE